MKLIDVVVRVDRERKADHEVFVRVAENCKCGYLEKSLNMSQMRVIVLVSDVNDNEPVFSEDWYQMGYVGCGV
jgi:hypothetical protein